MDSGIMSPDFHEQWDNYCRLRQDFRQKAAKDNQTWRRQDKQRRKRFWAGDGDFSEEWRGDERVDVR